MLNSWSNRAMAAKCRAIYGRRLTARDYAALCRVGRVPDAVAYLKTRTAYRDHLHSLGEDVHRGELEETLRRAYLERLQRLLRFNTQKNIAAFGFEFERQGIEKRLYEMAGTTETGVPHTEARLYGEYYKRLFESCRKTKGGGEAALLFTRQAEEENREVYSRLKEQFGWPEEEITPLLSSLAGRRPARHGAPAEEEMRRRLRFSSNTLTVFVSCAMLMRLEVENIIHIIEGIRYGRSPQAIEATLAGVTD